MSSYMTYFISGHLDLSKKEFQKYYQPQIELAIKQNSHFVVGDARGADTLSQNYLLKNGIFNVKIFHIGSKPRNYVSDKFSLYGGFKNDDERDSYMTSISDDDILWIRSAEEQQKRLGSKYDPTYINGTTKNLLRRQKI